MLHSGQETAVKVWGAGEGKDDDARAATDRTPGRRWLQLKVPVIPPKAFSLLARYGLALAVTGVALGLDQMSKSVLCETVCETATGLFILAAMVSAWYGGMGPGLVAVAAADLLNGVFYHNPHFSLSLFSVSALLVIWLTTRKRRAEGALRKLNDELEVRVASRTAALQESNNQLEEFCRTLAHDLRAPLRSMQGFAHLLIEESGSQLDAAAKDYAQRIATSSERMGQLILDLLAYTRISRAKYRLEKIDLTRVIGNVLQKFAAEIEDGRTVVSRKSSFPSITGDRVTVENAITNLISNALKFRDPKNNLGSGFGPKSSLTGSGYGLRTTASGSTRSIRSGFLECLRSCTTATLIWARGLAWPWSRRAWKEWVEKWGLSQHWAREAVSGLNWQRVVEATSVLHYWCENGMRVGARPHLCPMASQARHEMDDPQELCAPRNLVSQERVKRISSWNVLQAFGLIATSGKAQHQMRNGISIIGPVVF